MLRDITEACRHFLQSYPAASFARDAADKRLSREAQERYGFGYFPQAHELALLTDIFTVDKLISSGIFHYRFSDIEGGFTLRATLDRHNLIMPYRDGYGRIVALVGRSLLSDAERKEKGVPKYRNTSFTKSEQLFGLDRAKREILRKNQVFVVEGQFDAITMQEAGIENVVCLGSGQMSFRQYALISRYTKRIILLLDNDKAGDKGAERAQEKWGGEAEITRLRVPEGYKDIDEFLIKEGSAGKEYLESIS